MRFLRIPRDLIVPVVGTLTVVGLLVYMLLSVAALSSRLDDANQDRDRLQRQLDAQQKTSEALARQVEALGGDPIVDPEDAAEPADPVEPDDSTTEISKGDIALAVAAFCSDTGKCKGEPGEDGEDATPAQVARALVRYCDAQGECEGDDGGRGPAGPPPSETAIMSAVTAYCAGGACRGPAGPAGEDGEDSSIPGPQGEPGRPPTPEEIAQSVQAYCASHNQCQGPQGPPGQDSTVPGPPGPKGDNGEDAPQPRAMSCQSSGEPITITLSYSDGSTVTAECGSAQMVEPEPTQ